MDKYHKKQFRPNVLPILEVFLAYRTCSFPKYFKTNLFIQNLSNKTTSLVSYIIKFCGSFKIEENTPFKNKL